MKTKKDITLKLCIEDALYLRYIINNPICKCNNHEDPADIISRRYINKSLDKKIKQFQNNNKIE